MTAKKQGLYANIHAKQERIAHGSGEHMRKAGDDGAPSGEDFKKSEKTAKKKPAAKKTAARKTAAKKTATKKPAAKKTPAKKTTSRKAAARKA